ncbi:hypothetical protein [Nocardioides pacificus]
MFKKLPLLAAAGVGYVLGARAGRERYEQIAATTRKVAGNPKVQSAAKSAQDTVATQAPVVADAVKDKVTTAASAAADKVRKDDGSDGAPGDVSVTPGVTPPPAGY